ncbi:MAG: hypothetical protein WBY93_19400 [Candidatus Binatus sp.]
MSVEHSLNDNDIRVARALGVNLTDLARLKYTHGKSGLAGIALHADQNPYGAPALKYKPTDPGRNLGPEPRTVVEPEDSDSENPTRVLYDPVAGVVYPNGDTNVTKRAASK